MQWLLGFKENGWEDSERLGIKSHVCKESMFKALVLYSNPDTFVTNQTCCPRGGGRTTPKSRQPMECQKSQADKQR